MSAEALLEKGYNAYGEHVQWQNHLGRPMPRWAELPDKIRGAWAAFAREIVAGVQK